MLNGAIIPPPGRYVIAVSGGVDSVALLDVLAKAKKLELIVAHFNHGMRQDSGEDEKLARNLAEQYRLKFEAGSSTPGLLKSEDDARKARYVFLHKARTKYRARAVITAHHQDDLIETAFINVLRGTGRKGLSAISSNPKVLRPLLNVSKNEILRYAERQNLTWLEDPTNASNDYLRNYLRNQFLVDMQPQDRVELINNLQNVAKINSEVDAIIATLSRDLIKNNAIDRIKMTNLPHKVGDEVLAEWLRNNGLGSFDRKMLNKLSTAIKTSKAGTSYPINSGLSLVLATSRAYIKPTDSNS